MLIKRYESNTIEKDLTMTNKEIIGKLRHYYHYKNSSPPQLLTDLAKDQHPLGSYLVYFFKGKQDIWVGSIASKK